MPTTLRRLLPIVFSLIALAAMAPGAAAATTDLPTQSLGNRGADVRAIQGLLGARGFPVAIDGLFGPATASQVSAFQAAGGLPVNGIVSSATWSRLFVPLSPGSTGDAVKVVQLLLNEKRFAHIAVNGTFDAATRNAVVAFQTHLKMTPHGNVGPVTWTRLIHQYDYPAFTAGIVCDYSAGNGKANWATGAAIGQLEAAARAFVATGHGRIPIGDASREFGGDIPGHATHEVGLDVDIRPMRDANDQCKWGTNWRLSSYDRAATRILINAIRAAAPGHVKLIYFNDPVLIKEGLTTSFIGHDDHLHVRYCEVSHPEARYRC
jgi:peptidoglycan hydrolase-like protein with peptidoglycan-binding domain